MRLSLRVWFAVLAASFFVIIYYLTRAPLDLTIAPAESVLSHVPEPSPSDTTENRLLSLDDIQTINLIKSTFESGDIQKAIDVVRQMLSEDSSESHSTALLDWLKQQLPTLLIGRAWQQLKASDCSGAIEIFREAESLSASKDISRGLAYCYAKLKSYATAVTYFANYLAREPQDVQMRLLFVESLEADLRYEDALAALEEGKRFSDPANSIEPRTKAMRAKLQDRPKQSIFYSEHFRIFYFTSDQDQVTPQAADILERALVEFASNYGFVTPTTAIDVMLYPPDRLKEVSAGGPDWATGLYDGRIRVAVGQRSQNITANDFRTLRHELVHALLAIQNSNRGIPTWFNEGVAQILECENELCPLTDSIFPPRRGRFLPAAKLESSFLELDRIRAEISYRQSLFLVQQMVRESENRSMILEKIVQSIQLQNGNLSSESILTPVANHWKALYQKSARLWESGLIGNDVSMAQ